MLLQKFKCCTIDKHVAPKETSCSYGLTILIFKTGAARPKLLGKHIFS